MFDQVFESLRKATEASIQVQQDLFKKWVSLWPGMPGVPGMPVAPAAGAEPYIKFQKKWAEFVAEVVKKQRETLEAHFSAGLRNIEEAFRLTDAKSPEEWRAKTVELWQKSFECIRQMYETQVRDLQAVVAKWTELVMKGAA
jgi:hypothetical protein